MEHQGNTQHSGRGGGKSSGSVAKNAAIRENLLMPRFNFHVEHWAPRDEDREHAIALRDRRDAFVKDGLSDLAAAADREYQSLLRKVGTEDFSNLVTTGGANDLLDKYFAGSGYTAAWYFGLIDGDGYTTGPAAGDTMASHGGWAESTEYSQANRVAITFAAASGGTKSTSATSDFSINASTTIKGAFCVADNTKGGTTGVLYSAGLFTGGDRTGLQNGDTLKVSGSFTITPS